MQRRPTFSPFEVEGKLLRDSRLEERLQYGEHQQARVQPKVRNVVKLPSCYADDVLMSTYQMPALLISGRSRAANWNIHANVSQSGLGSVEFSPFFSHVNLIYLIRLQGMMLPSKSSHGTSDIINSSSTSFGLSRVGDSTRNEGKGKVN